MSAPETWMQDARETGDRIGGMLHVAAVQWSMGQHNPARSTLEHVLKLLHEQERIISAGMSGTWRKGD